MLFRSDDFLVVCNGANRAKILAHFQAVVGQEDLNVKIDDADAKPKGGDSDLPDWTSCDPFDVNIDGKVDMEDFAELLANFGTAEGDLTGNGLVDGEDLGLLLIRISNLPRN